MNMIRQCKLSLVMTSLLCLLAVVLAVGIVPRSAEAAPLELESFKWLKTTFEGPDDFYDGNIVAYKSGDNAELMVIVRNWSGSDVAFGSATLKVDWSSVLVNAVEYPTTIAKDSYGVIIWNFDASAVSNWVTHGYEFSVKYGNEEATGGSSDLVIYSDEQAACRASIELWTANDSAYALWGYEGRRLMTEASYFKNKADDEYNSGNFAAAKADYDEAVKKQEQAINKDASCALTTESAVRLQGTGGAKGMGYLIAGIGVLLAGAGVAVGMLFWSFRRRGTA
jgi:hypothetical protein